MLARVLTAALAIYSSPFSWATPSIRENKPYPQVEDNCRQITPVPNFYDFYALPAAITPILSKELISSTIIGMSFNECQYITKQIMELTEIHTNIENYVTFVFTHSPLFRIVKETVSRPEQFGLRAKAEFRAADILLNIGPGIFQETDRKVIEILRHEFRHIAINTAHRVLKTSSASSAEIYYPSNSTQRIKAFDMLEQGKQQVNVLRKLLEIENKPQYKQTKLTDKQIKRLARLRHQTKAIYLKYYQSPIKKTIPQSAFNDLNSLLPEPLAVGRKSQVDSYANELEHLYGWFNVTKLDSFIHNGEAVTSITFIMDDPLYALINHYNTIQLELDLFYEPYERTFETDAHLNQFFPQNLLSETFRNLSVSTNALINRGRSVPVNYQKKSVIDYRAENSTVRIEREFNTELRNPSLFFSGNARIYVDRALKAIQNNNVEFARTAMQTLIKNRHDLHDANLVLGLIAYTEADFANCIKYVETAKKYQKKDAVVKIDGVSLYQQAQEQLKLQSSATRLNKKTRN